MIECNEIYNTIVYQHRRLDNNEIFYIGIGTNKYRPNNKITRSSFWKNITNKTDYKIEILFDNLLWTEACEVEKYLISYYGRKDTTKTGTLCNMTDGGEGRYNSRHSKETLKKLSDCRIGKKLSNETKKRMSNNSARSRKVIDTSNNIIYKSATEVSKLFNINLGTLCFYLRGSRTNKTTFKYLENDTL